MVKLYDLFMSDKVTDVKTVEEFLDRYYKPDRYKGRGEEYAKTVLKHQEVNFRKDGVAWISQFGSVTGHIVSFYGGRA